MSNSLENKAKPCIPVQLTESEFNEFIFVHSPARTRGPWYKVSRFKVFNYILKFVYMGCQWKMLPIDKDRAGRPEIHYSQIFRIFQKWLKCGAFLKIFENSVFTLDRENLLDTSVTHGNGIEWLKKAGIVWDLVDTNT